ncbi:TonB-dependent receptor plug domain-containing protein [Tenacibaculum sp. M341]|uniref:TonB-dependent receptor plug domain-containing protein n=2 Tax=Tenacibaculum TaxID=104267 RepID=UPI001044B257|nr:TonB-dependent receptor [Tenacibaculum sp. M341]TCI85096.1 TonB-dependent receptor [Tenacibaculum sp. M341]
MFLNKSLIIIVLLSLLNFFAEGQVKEQDSIKMNKLDEVIVVGESNLMSLSKKLFNVGVINKKDIAKVAGNNLADILTQNLNLTIIPDASTGRSTVSLFGLDGQYTKILIDGIPMVSDNGVGNNIDITQINLEDVERVEIVEGSMGVLYGDNAVAGVINVVTKRGLKNHKWQIQLSTQEETVGVEYNFNDRGRHIQNFKLSNQINKKVSYSVGFSRNNFEGFYNTFRGRDYVNIQDNIVVNDQLRGTEWNPKEQLTFSANVDFKLGRHKFFYKFQNFNELVNVYDRFVTGRLDAGTGQLIPTATDENFKTDRYVNNLTVSGPLKGKTKYNLFFSQQNQKRYYEEYVYNIFQRGVESYITDALSQSSDFWYTKGFVSNITPNSDFFNLQLGYEFLWQTGFDAIATGNYSTQVVENSLSNYDFFAVTDFDISEKLSFHPGARVTNNSQFGNQFIWQFTSNYKITEDITAKGVFGSAFRAPNFEELFFYFVDANHNVRGNPNLQPEDGISIFLDVNKDSKLSEKTRLKTIFKGFYFDIEDEIASIITEDEDGRTLFTTDNVDNTKTAGVSLQNTINSDRWNFGIGATYIGKATSISSIDDFDPEYLWRLDVQTNVDYIIPKIKTTLTGQLKYTGKRQTLLLNNGDIQLGQTDGFSWFDASIKTDIINNLVFTLGARNIFDVVTVNASDVPSEGHDASVVASRLFGNGRSYFFKLLYNINFN